MVNYKLLTLDGDRYLTVYVPGGDPLLASSETHGNFDELVRLAQAGDESVVELFDTQSALNKAFADIVVGRVAVRDGKVFFDDDAMDNAITEAILRFREAGEPLGPTVAFMENVMANPQVESREQFYRYVQAYNLPITDDGHVILYKGVYADDADGTFQPTHNGHGFVNGVEVHGKLVQKVGDVVTMPRAEVDFDPNSACSTGLHCGTHSYARGYGSTLLYVKVNPRDVVSVPHDVSSQKVRVCRYEILGIADRNAEYAAVHWKEAVKDDAPDDVPTEPDFEYVKADRYNVSVGDKVVVNDAQALSSNDAKRMVSGTEYTVTVADPHYLITDDSPEKGGVWHHEVLVKKPVAKGRKAQYDDSNSVTITPVPVDTRLNHTKQKRDASGRFVRKAKV